MARKAIAGFVLMALLVGCASTGSQAGKTSGLGALLGALAGAAAAIATGQSGDQIAKYAAAGAVAGAVVGYAIGKSQDNKLASRESAAQKYAYASNQGNLLKVESVAVEPATLSAGGQGQVKIVYTVLTPGEWDTVNVNYARALYYGADEVQSLGSESSVVDNGGGTIEVTCPLTLPSNAPAGTYTFQATVSLPGASLSETESATFYVQS